MGSINSGRTKRALLVEDATPRIDDGPFPEGGLRAWSVVHKGAAAMLTRAQVSGYDAPHFQGFPDEELTKDAASRIRSAGTLASPSKRRLSGGMLVRNPREENPIGGPRRPGPQGRDGVLEETMLTFSEVLSER